MLDMFIMMMMMMINVHGDQLWFMKDNTWFTLKSCSFAKRAFQAHYSFDDLGGYKGLYCSKYYETQI